MEDEYLKGDDAVEEIIKEIDDLDKCSFGFRYAYVGTNTINAKVKYSINKPVAIDLKNLKSTMIKMMNNFEGIHSQVVYYLDEKQSNL